MKRFSKILICLLLCVFSLSMFACKDKRTPEEKAFTYPTSADITLGNGGMAVQKGNYLYYVNGYKSILSEDRTQDERYTHGALMLMKLNSDGSIVTDENNLLKDDYYITMSNLLCGFEVSSLYIAGNYLYFTACSVENVKDGAVKDESVWAKEYVEFYRIKLDKSSNPERIYQADIKYSDSSKLDFEYYSSGNNVFILIYEPGETLADNSDKNNAIVRVTGSGEYNEVANNVSSYVFGANANEIFYSTSENSKTLVQYNAVESGEGSTYTIRENSFTIDSVSSGNVYIKENGNLLASSIANKTAFDEVCFATGDYTKVVADNNRVIAVRDNKFNFFADDLKINRTETDNDVTSINVIGCVNSCIIYYADDNKTIKSFSYVDGAIKTLAVVEDLDTNYFDLQEDYIYFYKKVNSNPYLHRVKIANNIENEVEMVGVYLEEDAPEIEEEEIVEE